MENVEIEEYQNIIFDLDGVVFDSNIVKHQNIEIVINKYCNPKKAKEIIDYFTANNGIPREVKINNFFAKEVAEQILKEYNSLNATTLMSVPFTNGIKTFFDYLDHFDNEQYILSGGDKNEINILLKHKGILSRFALIMGGPKTKHENLQTHSLTGNTLYIGDSKIDYEVSVDFQFDFIFMYAYSKFLGWHSFFKDKNDVVIIKDFTELANCDF